MDPSEDPSGSASALNCSKPPPAHLSMEQTLLQDLFLPKPCPGLCWSSPGCSRIHSLSLESFPRISWEAQWGWGNSGTPGRVSSPAGNFPPSGGSRGAVLLYHQRWGDIVLFLEAMAKADVGGEPALRSLRQAGMILQDEK